MIPDGRHAGFRRKARSRTGQLAGEQNQNEVLGKIKLGRLGQVEDLTGAVVYLVSDASALVTGTSLLVDGGWTAE